ncbi:hypothetical protein M3J09_013022 [Ascochyta lentis]
MTPSFKTIILFTATLFSSSLARSDCLANILNENNSVVGSGCIAPGGVLLIHTNTGRNYNIAATSDCGLSITSQQVLPSGWTLGYGGGCRQG